MKPEFQPEFEAILEKLRVNDPSLTSLDLDSKEITDADIKKLAIVLPSNRALGALSLWKNWIGNAGAKDLSLALQENRTLTSLNLINNLIGDAGAEDLSLALQENHTLTSLYLTGNRIGDAGAEDLSLALKENHTLTRLDLESNPIGDAGAEDLSLALQENRTLTMLSLGNNKIGAAGAKALSLALQKNHPLTTLGLGGGNPIGDAGVKDLSLALKENRTLTSLYLSGNRIGDAGAKDLSLALKENHTLTALSLVDNQIGDAGAKALSLALKENHTLRALYLYENQIGNTLQETLKAFINRNIQLVEESYQAAQQGNVDQVRQALQQGVSLLGYNRDDDSNTLLHVAAKKGHSALMQFLITHCKAEGLPLNPRNYQGQTPADLARAQGHTAILALLESSPLPLEQPAVPTATVISLPHQPENPRPLMSIEVDRSNLQTWVVKQSTVSAPQSLLPLDTNQQNSLIALLTKVPDFVTRCELAQMPKRQELSYALATDAEKMQQVKEQKSIAQQPLLQGYYFTFQRILNQTFIAALAISSELIKNDQAASRAGSASSALGLVMKALTVVAGAVPGLSAATSILSVLMEKGLAIHANNQLTRLVSIAPGPAQMEYLIERIARQLTLQLAEGLQQLTEKKTFPLWDALKTFYAKAKKPFVVELAETLQQRQAVEDALQLLKALMQADKTFDRNQDFVAESVRYLLAFKQNKQNTQDTNQKKKEINVDKTARQTAATFPLGDSSMSMLLAMQAKLEEMERREKSREAEMQQLRIELKTRDEQHAALQQEFAEIKRLFNTETLENRLAQQAETVQQLTQKIERQGDKADQTTVSAVQTQLTDLAKLSAAINDRQSKIEKAHQDVRSIVSKIPTDFLAASGETQLTSMDFAQPNQKLQAFRFKVHEMEEQLTLLLTTVSEHHERLDQTEHRMHVGSTFRH